MTSEFKLFTLVIRFLRKAINALIKMYGEGSSKKRESHKRSLALGGFEFLEARLVLSADPLLVQKQPLMVAPAGSGTITSSLLATSDADNTAAELTYSITTLPAQGTLKKNGAVAGWLVNPANGHYYRSGVPSSWTDANAEATALGGYLVSIQNGAENQWLLEHFAGIGQGWIGFTTMVMKGRLPGRTASLSRSRTLNRAKLTAVALRTLSKSTLTAGNG